MGQVTIFSGAQRQRHWSDDEKRSMVAAAFAEDAIVSIVARRFEVAACQLYRWRRLYAARDRAIVDRAAVDFASVVVTEDAVEPRGVLPPPDVLTAPAARASAASRAVPVMIVEAGGARVEIMSAASPKLVAATLAALKR